MARAREIGRDLAESRWSRWDPDLGVNRGAGITATKHRVSTGWGIICEREASTYTTCGIVCKRDSRGAEFVGPCILASCILVGWRNGIQEAEESLNFKYLVIGLHLSQSLLILLQQKERKISGEQWIRYVWYIYLQGRQTASWKLSFSKTEGTWRWLAEMEMLPYQMCIFAQMNSSHSLLDR